MAADPVQLPVHVRRVVDGNGEMRSENEVYCLARQSCVSVAECEACVGYVGADVDLYRHRNYVLCKKLTPESARALEPARTAVLRRRYVSDVTDGDRTPVREIMTADVWCARDDLPLAKLRDILAERHFSGVPVVDGAGRCIGVVSVADLARTTKRDAHVRDVMTRLTFVLPDNASVSQAAALMALEHIHRIPIVTDDGRVAGIVSSIDILGWLGRKDGYVIPR